MFGEKQIVTNLKLKSSSDAGKRPKEGSNCIPRDTEGEFEALLNCCKRDHRSLYNRSSLGYSPSNACFKNVEAKRKETIPFIAEHFRYYENKHRQIQLTLGCLCKFLGQDLCHRLPERSNRRTSLLQRDSL